MEIANLKNSYQKKINGMERQMDQLKNENKQLQMTLENQKQNYKLQLTQQEQKTQDQMRTLKQQNHDFKENGQMHQQHINLYKQEFQTSHSLIVSED